MTETTTSDQAVAKATDATSKAVMLTGLLAASIANTSAPVQGLSAPGTTETAVREAIPDERPPARPHSLQYWGISRQLVQDVYAPMLDQLLEQRARLVRTQLTRALNAQEEKELHWVRWQLNVIEDAELGPSLDRLERFVEKQEKIARMVANARWSDPRV